MDNIGDYGYLIFLLIVFLLRTVFGKKKSAPGGPKPAGRSLEDILGDLFEDNKPEAPTPRPAPVPQRATPPPPAVSRPATVLNTEAEPVNEYMRYLQEKDQKRVIIRDSAPLEVVDLDDISVEQYEFDLRQAIISQVVLERKYT